jgi:hypothetical protein
MFPTGALPNEVDVLLQVLSFLHDLVAPTIRKRHPSLPDYLAQQNLARGPEFFSSLLVSCLAMLFKLLGPEFQKERCGADNDHERPQPAYSYDKRSHHAEDTNGDGEQ